MRITRRISGRTKRAGKPRHLARTFHAEVLEKRVLLAVDTLVISEFMASNDSSLLDQFGLSRDWVEIFNPTPTTMSLKDWHLTDDADQMDKWTFPDVILESGQFLTVFASGENIRDTTDSLHTNFRLSASGEYLALVKPDMTVAHEFSDEFPQQFTDVSFGLGANTIETGTDAATFQYHVPRSSDAAIGSDWTGIEFDDSSWKESTAALSQGVGFAVSSSADDFEGQFATDVGLDMLINNASLWIRHSFDVADPDDIDGLILDINYDDGFVAYLNGVEVLEMNAPEDGVQWDSEADMPRRPRRRLSDALESERFDLGEFAGLIEPGKNVFSIHGLNDTSIDQEFLLRARLRGVNMDVDLSPDSHGYLSEFTPGTANRPLQGGSVEVSHSSTFFTEPFSVELSTHFANQTIRYTTDGSDPDTTSSVYSEPIPVTDSVNLKAAAFATDGSSGPVSIRSYIQLADDVSEISSDLPIVVMSTDVNTLSAIAKNRPVHSTIALYEPGDDGRTTVLSEPAWVTDASLDRRGSSTAGNPKINMAVEFQNESGSDRDLPFLGMPAEADWIFHAPYNFDRTGGVRNSFYFEIGNQVGPWAPRTRFVEVYHAAQGREISPDDYQGIYVIIEKIKRGENRVDINKLPPEDFESSELSGDFIFKIDRNDAGDGGFRGGRQAILWVNPKEEEIEGTPQAAAVAGFFDNMDNLFRDRRTTFQQIEQVIDVPSWIDHSIVNHLAWNVDALRLSGYSYMKDGVYYMGPNWDCDRCMGSEDGRDSSPETWDSVLFNSPSSVEWWEDLYRNQPDFWQFWIDRWHELRRDVLSEQTVTSTIHTFAGQIEESQERNFARWSGVRPNGGRLSDPGLSGWEEEVSHHLNWVLRRLTWTDEQFIALPTITPAGGRFTPNQEIVLEAPEGGDIYFTIDGSDPRASGGAVADTALKYEAPFTLTEPTIVTVRVFDESVNIDLNPNGRITGRKAGSPWSAPETVHFTAEAVASASNFRISEINYNPYDATDSELQVLGEEQVNNDEFEFLEFVNISDEPIQLGGVQLVRTQAFDNLAGVDFTFAEQTLAPGERLVVVEDDDAFKVRYGSDARIAAGNTGEDDATEGQFGGRLENRGETLRMIDRFGDLIMRLRYNDSGDWPERADGNGSSLELVDATGDFTDPANWRPSGQFGGSPGTSGAEAISRLVVSEILTSSTVEGGDKLELHNASNQPIDLNGWFISDSGQEFQKFKVAEPTVIPSGGYLVFTESQLGFGFDEARGGELVVVEANAAGQPISFAATVHFGNALPNVSLGRSPLTSTDIIPLENQTFGFPNSGPRTGDVIISEIAYHPPDPDANGPRRSRDMEFIELYNRTANPIDIAGWRLSGTNVDFTFEENTVIDAGGTLIAVRFLPTDASRQSVFRFFYGLGVSEPLYGRISSRHSLELPDDEGTYRLERNGDPTEDGFVPVFLMDEVSYTNQTPWPTDIDGGGKTLTRVSPTALGNLPASWTSAPASAGEVDFSAPPQVVGDSNHDGVFNQLDIVSILQGAKFLSGEPATFEEGDWNGDGLFNQLDIVAALQAGTYQTGLAAITGAKSEPRDDAEHEELVDVVFAKG